MLASNVGSFQAALLDAGLLIPGAVRGIYGCNAVFEAVIAGFERLVNKVARHDAAEYLRFPPVMSQKDLQKNGYFSVFPHFAGCVHCFMGDDADHRRLVGKLICEEDCGDEFQPSGVALVPAACYPIYPTLAARGLLPQGGLTIGVGSYCYRHEESADPARQQSFRMNEFVRIGPPDRVAAFRELWLDRAKDICAQLQLSGRLDVANDPFFGDGGAKLAEQQQDASLKFEMLIAAGPDREERACMSFNAHHEHFAAIWNLRLPDGHLAHTACVAFGMERVALALLAQHGVDVEAWPKAVIAALELEAGSIV